MAPYPELECQLSEGEVATEEQISGVQMNQWFETLEEMIRFCDSHEHVAPPELPEEQNSELQEIIRQFERIRDYYYANMDKATPPQDDSDGMVKEHEDHQAKQQATAPEIVIDADGGFYDEKGYYHDKDGQCYAPVGIVPEGHILCHDEQGNAYFEPSVEKQEKQEVAVAVLQLKNDINGSVKLQDPQAKQQATAPEIVLDAEGGYYDEKGYYHDKDGQCYAPIGIVPEGHVLCHDEQGNAYYEPSAETAEAQKQLTKGEKEHARQ